MFKILTSMTEYDHENKQNTCTQHEVVDYGYLFKQL